MICGYWLVFRIFRRGLVNDYQLPVADIAWKQWFTEEGFGGGGGEFNPLPRHSEVLTKLSRIPSSVENTSITT
jgi:hypothetical protein